MADQQQDVAKDSQAGDGADVKADGDGTKADGQQDALPELEVRANGLSSLFEAVSMPFVRLGFPGGLAVAGIVALFYSKGAEPFVFGVFAAFGFMCVLLGALTWPEHSAQLRTIEELKQQLKATSNLKLPPPPSGMLPFDPDGVQGLMWMVVLWPVVRFWVPVCLWVFGIVMLSVAMFFVL